LFASSIAPSPARSADASRRTLSQVRVSSSPPPHRPLRTSASSPSDSTVSTCPSPPSSLPLGPAVLVVASLSVLSSAGAPPSPRRVLLFQLDSSPHRIPTPQFTPPPHLPRDLIQVARFETWRLGRWRRPSRPLRWRGMREQAAVARTVAAMARRRRSSTPVATNTSSSTAATSARSSDRRSSKTSSLAGGAPPLILGSLFVN
jgi:hypothetical protein